MLRTPETPIPLVAENDRAIGRRVRLFRVLRLFSIEELCIAAKLDAGHLLKIEDGSACPSISQVAALAAALDIPAYVLIVGAHRSSWSKNRH